MNGKSLTEKSAAIRPEMKVIYTAGYTGFSHSALINPGLVFLPKPFTKQILLGKLREVLASGVELKAGSQ